MKPNRLILSYRVCEHVGPNAQRISRAPDRWIRLNPRRGDAHDGFGPKTNKKKLFSVFFSVSRVFREI